MCVYIIYIYVLWLLFGHNGEGRNQHPVRGRTPLIRGGGGDECPRREWPEGGCPIETRPRGPPRDPRPPSSVYIICASVPRRKPDRRIMRSFSILGIVFSNPFMPTSSAIINARHHHIRVLYGKQDSANTRGYIRSDLVIGVRGAIIIIMIINVFTLQ